MSLGFLRVIRSEQAMAKITWLDVDTSSASKSVASSITHKLKCAGTKDSGCDTEFWLHGGVLQISRYTANQSLNGRSVEPASSLQRALLPLETPLSGKHTEQGFVFKASSDPEKPGLSQDEVELQVHAAELDKNGLYAHAEDLIIVAGKVIGAGKSLGQSSVGQGFVGYTNKGYSTVVRLPAYLGHFSGLLMRPILLGLYQVCAMPSMLWSTLPMFRRKSMYFFLQRLLQLSKQWQG